MKITNQQILSLHDAIAALDGAQVTQVVEGRAVQVFKGYRLAHGARWALARNLGRLQTHAADFNRARSALIKQHAGGQGAISPSHPSFNAFASDLESLTHQPVELALDTIALSDLNLPENEIPIAVLNALAPLIQGEVQSPIPKAQSQK